MGLRTNSSGVATGTESAIDEGTEKVGRAEGVKNLAKHDGYVASGGRGSVALVEVAVELNAGASALFEMLRRCCRHSLRSLGFGLLVCKHTELRMKRSISSSRDWDWKAKRKRIEDGEREVLAKEEQARGRSSHDCPHTIKHKPET